MTTPAGPKQKPDEAPVEATATVAQLKDDIASGRTGDKVAYPDPGLSPLGTDAEAGGFPPTPKEIALMRRQERRGRPKTRATDFRIPEWDTLGFQAFWIAASVLSGAGLAWLAR